VQIIVKACVKIVPKLINDQKYLYKTFKSLISWIKVEKALFLIALKLYFKENN
jgi:hypothetical protein